MTSSTNRLAGRGLSRPRALPRGPSTREHSRWGVRRALLAVSLALLGCYEAHARPADGGPCGAVSRPRCAARPGPCEPLALVDAVCDGEAWACPAGSAPYVAPWTEDRCLPLADRIGLPLADGVHEALLPVPLDGRCAWVFPHDDGSGAPALVATAAASRCAALERPGPPIADVEGEADYANLQAAITLPDGSVRVLARGWAIDAAAPFGVRSLGVGLGRVERGRIAIDDRWLFGDDVDLGDAAVVHDGFAYAYGCPGAPVWLEEDCIVGRAPLGSVDDAGAWSILGEDGWGDGSPRRVFGSGPHRSSVLRDPRGAGFLHVFAIGFGTALRIQSAPSPEGPWSEPIDLAPCELPAGDPGAYCAGPVVHRELIDPLAPDVLVVGYSIGTTSDDGAARRARDPRGYWPRIVRVPIR